jgi:hypothetical protein
MKVANYLIHHHFYLVIIKIFFFGILLKYILKNQLNIDFFLLYIQFYFDQTYLYFLFEKHSMNNKITYNIILKIIEITFFTF